MNARELARSNAELSRFANAAAHDLRSPLRGIRDLAEWTLEDAGNALPDQCRKNLGRLTSRVDRLSTPLGDLLDYSRVGQDESSLGEIDLASLPAETLGLIGAENRFSVAVDGDPGTMLTYAAPLRRVFLNIISNAVKHHDRGHGHLSIGFRSLQDRVQIVIQDDGPGIEQKYHDRIFELFQTLRSRDDVEGSGMGLAIIRKLIEHFGGTISVRSDPANQRGTSFVFSWPIAVEEKSGRLAA